MFVIIMCNYLHIRGKEYSSIDVTLVTYIQHLTSHSKRELAGPGDGSAAPSGHPPPSGPNALGGGEGQARCQAVTATPEAPGVIVAMGSQAAKLGLMRRSASSGETRDLALGFRRMAPDAGDVAPGGAKWRSQDATTATFCRVAVVESRASCFLFQTRGEN